MAFAWLVLVAVSCKFDKPAQLPEDADVEIDAAVDAAIDATPSDLGAACVPLLTNQCFGVNNRCTWFKDTTTTGHAGCAPAGNVPAGAECSFAPPGPTGYSNCAGGADCFGNLCAPLCDLSVAVASRCDTNHACSRYNSLYSDGGTTTHGACDSKCNPLTQARFDGAAACGSPTSDSPTIGCYLQNRAFACARILSQATTRTDRMAAYGSFSNGCAAGFVPVFSETTGSVTAICSGICAPSKTDTTLAANVRGNASTPVKLPNEVAPLAGNGVCVAGKKGSQPAAANENCLFAWGFFRDENGVIDPEIAGIIDTFGLCFLSNQYRWDSNADGMSDTNDRLYPSCNLLPPRTTLPASCTCDATTHQCRGTGCPDGVADEWGCYAYLDSPHLPVPRANWHILDTSPVPLQRHVFE